MKKQKIITPFFFKKRSHQEMVDHINRVLPIDIRYSEELINRIHLKYPVIEKSSIAYIVKMIFQSFRDFLILGKILNFNSLFFDTKLFFFARHEKGLILPRVKVKISTPPPMRNSKCLTTI